MKSKFIIAISLVATIFLASFPVQALARANPNIDQASIVFSSSMGAGFSLTASNNFNVSITSVKLEVKESNGTWSFVKNLPAPSSATNVTFYNRDMDYSSHCTKGKTYRIKATFNAGSESVSRTSAEKTYN